MFAMRLMVYLALLMAVTHMDGKRRPKCGQHSDCAADDEDICVLDPKNVCFRRFNSQCDLAASECDHKQKYLIYPGEYCDNTGFLCDADYEQYVKWWQDNENMNKTIYSIYDKTENAASRAKSFWNKMLNIKAERGSERGIG